MLDVSYKKFAVGLVTQQIDRLLKHEILNKSLSVCRIRTPPPENKN